VAKPARSASPGCTAFVMASKIDRRSGGRRMPAPITIAPGL
jgi:hypothetical protein